MEATLSELDYDDEASLDDDGEELVTPSVDLRASYSADSLKAYINGLPQGPLLTRFEERELARRRDLGDKAAQDRLVTANLRLAISIAKRYLWSGIPFIDLIQEGNLGLIRAAEDFDPTNETKFSTYATWWIRQHIVRYVYSQDGLIRSPVHVREEQYKYWKLEQALEEKYGRAPTFDEIAAAADTTVSRVENAYAARKTIVSLDKPAGADESSTVGDFIPDETVDAIGVLLHDLESATIAKVVRDAMDSALTPVQRRVLELRYGIGVPDDAPEKVLNEKTGEPMQSGSLEAIGHKLGITRERVRQIEVVATLALMRYLVFDAVTGGLDLPGVPAWTGGAKDADEKFRIVLVAYKRWIADHGRLPRELEWPLETPDTPFLASWAEHQRRRLDQLSPERVVALNEISGWKWTAPRWGKSLWDRQLANSRLFREHHDRATPDAAAAYYEEARLGKWERTQRMAYRRAALKDDDSKALEQLPGWDWDHERQRDHSMAKNFDAYKEFYNVNNRLPSPTSRNKGERALALWMKTRCNQYFASIGNRLIQNTPERIAQLNELGRSVWERKDGKGGRRSKWESNYQRLLEATRDGSSVDVVFHEDAKLEEWVNAFRDAYANGKLVDYHIELLQALPGWTWEPDEKSGRYESLQALAQ